MGPKHMVVGLVVADRIGFRAALPSTKDPILSEWVIRAPCSRKQDSLSNKKITVLALKIDILESRRPAMG
jgi:hypothetical protein